MTTLALFDIGFGEMVVVGFVALLLFGGRLPEVMRTLGLAYRKFRTGMDDLTRQTSKVLDVRSVMPPYKPTPPQSTPVARASVPTPAPTPSMTGGPPLAAPASDAGPVGRSMPGALSSSSSGVAPAARDLSDDPPPV